MNLHKVIALIMNETIIRAKSTLLIENELKILKLPIIEP